MSTATENGIDINDGKSIRTAIKRTLGYNSRQVRVRIERYSMGQTTHLTIADPKVDYRRVKDFATRCERITKDSYSGEILSGGNTFLEIGVTDDVMRKWATPLAAPIAAAIAKISNASGEPVEGLNLFAWKGKWPGDFHLTRRDDPNSWRTPDSPDDLEGITMTAARAYRDLGQDVFSKQR